MICSKQEKWSRKLSSNCFLKLNNSATACVSVCYYMSFLPSFGKDRAKIPIKLDSLFTLAQVPISQKNTLFKIKFPLKNNQLKWEVLCRAQKFQNNLIRRIFLKLSWKRNIVEYSNRDSKQNDYELAIIIIIIKSKQSVW